MIGASPAEAPNETWGMGQSEDGTGILVRYTSGSGWSLGPPLLNAAGAPLAGFKLDQPGTPAPPSVLAGQVTAAGSGALVGTVPSGSAAPRQVVLVRSPGGSFRETAPIPVEGEAGGILKTGFSIFAAANRAPLLAPLDESTGRAGLLIVPVAKGEAEDTVLHWDDGTREWTSEAIEVPASSSTEFQVVGIGASSPTNAWLIARLSSGEYALFRRQVEGGAAPKWVPVSPAPGQTPGSPLTVRINGGAETESFTVPNAPNNLTQVLTVTGEGIWNTPGGAEGRARRLCFEPQGETGSASVTSWCAPHPGAPACDFELPEALPVNTMRSYAWANPALPYGERVISGLPEGVTLRLDGSGYTRVLALGSALRRTTWGARTGRPSRIHARGGWASTACPSI